MFAKNQENINNIQNQNLFYRAVVENNDDGGIHGKCQVRIFGIHPVNAQRSSKNIGVIVEDLPWAELMISTSFHGGVSSFGISAVPLKGSWVWVFLDGGDWNRPIIIGLISGTSNMQRPDGSKESWGFHDPSKTYPIKPRLGEPDINRYCANRKVLSDSLIGKIKDENRDKGISTVTGKTWDELKELTSAVIYPNNTVFETIGESFIEYDESDGSRLHWFHNSGTYWEVVKDGDYSLKVTRDRYEIVDRDLYRLNKRDEFHTIQRDSEYKIDRDEFRYVGRHHKETVEKTVVQEYNSTQETTVKDSVTRTYKNTLSESVKSTVTQNYSSTQTTTVQGNVMKTYSSNLFETVTGNVVRMCSNLMKTVSGVATYSFGSLMVSAGSISCSTSGGSGGTISCETEGATVSCKTKGGDITCSTGSSGSMTYESGMIYLN